MKAFLRASFLGTVLFFMLYTASAQIGVSYHQSGLPFAGLQYNFSEVPIMAEFRLGTDSFFENETISIELVGTYSFINKPQHEVYGGIGLRVFYLDGIVFPIGLKMYPIQDFPALGLHIEVAPSIATSEFDSASFLRGSWGIHYIFGRNNEE